MFQNNAMFKPCWGIIILLLVNSVKLGQLFPMGKNQGNVLINVSYNCRASDDNTVLFLWHSLHKVISANTIPKMWKGGEEVLRNVWEDWRRYLCKIWFESCQILISIFCSWKTFGGGVPMKSSPSKLPPSAARLAYLSAHKIDCFFQGFRGAVFVKDWYGWGNVFVEPSKQEFLLFCPAISHRGWLPEEWNWRWKRTNSDNSQKC